MNLTSHITNTLAYSQVCHRESPEDSCFVQADPLSLTLAFQAGTREAFVSTLSKFSTGDVAFRLVATPSPGDTINSMKWPAYAVSTLVTRFYSLALKADSLDILLILTGYILMHTTFILLVARSRQLGSNFWLPIGILSSSVLALLIALPLAMALHIPMDPVALTEALPFLVCAVGFDKPLRLARAVFSHPHLTLSPRPNGPVKVAGLVVIEALTSVSKPIIRDYLLEIAVLVIGANSRVSGLKEVCALAALIVAIDCFCFATYFLSILTIMVEVRRIKAIRAASRPAAAPGTPTSILSRSSSSANLAADAAPKTLSSSLLGPKGSLLNDTQAKQTNPVARLKLLLVSGTLFDMETNCCRLSPF